MPRPLNSKFYLVLLSFISFSVSLNHAQEKLNNVIPNENGMILNLYFEKEPYNIEGEKLNKINYFQSIDEGNPNAPILPSKTYFIAIPPDCKIEVKLIEPKYNFIRSILPESNPTVKLTNDSSLIYSESKIDPKFFISNTYPEKDIEIEGYTWIRDYYCAVLKINTHSYNWVTREIREITSTKVKIEFSAVKPFRVNNKPLAKFDENLDKVILNYNEAKEFRSYLPNNIQNDTTGNWIDYSKEYVKLLIPNDGLYKIDYNELQSYSINPSIIDPTTFKIFQKGLQIPLYIFGESDQSFDPGDYIEFWAEKNYGSSDYREIVAIGEDYKNYLDRYSDTSVVWLTWDGDPGTRTEIHNNYKVGLTDSITSHKAKVHLEENTRLWFYGFVQPRVQLPFWQENKVWTWLQANGPGNSALNFNADFIVPDSPVFTISRLISWFVDTGIIRVNAHRFAAKLNSSEILDTVTFDFEQTGNLISVFNSAELLNGSNTYNIVGIPNDAATPHQALVDWVDIDYYQYTNAVNDSILINIPDSVTTAQRVIRVSNITVGDSSLLIYKINPSPQKITNFQIASGNLTFTDTVSGSDRYYIISDNKYQSPLFRKKKMFTNLRDPSRFADYIIISNSMLESSVTEYGNFISNNYNVNVQTIYVDDIYDEFAYGYMKPEPIRDLLQYAYSNWQAPSPSYLMIIGDGTYDYKELFTSVPEPRKKILVPSYGNPVSDVWFTTWDTTNTDIQQMYVGRIPANSNEEVQNYLNKHQTYINREFDIWNKTFLFFSGGNTSNPAEIAQIKSTNDQLLNNIALPAPVGGAGVHYYKTLDPPTNYGPYSAEEIQNSLDEGGLFISYIGHSGTQTWDNGITQVEDLQNDYANKYPLITDFGCSTGKFAEPDVDAFGELFTTQSENGQAILYLGNSSLGYTSTSFTMPQLFYSHLLIDSINTAGIVHFLAKLDRFNQSGFTTSNRVFSYCNLLLGDPIIEFANPLKPNFVVNSNSIIPLSSNLSSSDDSAHFKILIQNWGRVLNDSLEVNITSLFEDTIVYIKQFKYPPILLLDSLEIAIPILGLSGEHKLKIVLDENNLLDEIREDDNMVEETFLVFSNSVRPLESEEFYNTSRSNIKFLNPSVLDAAGSNEILLSIADNPSFNNEQLLLKNLDTVTTTVQISNLIWDKRYWWRARLNTENSDWGITNSFYNNFDFSWFFNHSFNNNDIISERIQFDSTTASWKLTNGMNQLKIVSAGSNEGKFASIRFNLEEALPNTFFWGIATAEIDTLTLEPFGFRYFAWPNSIGENSDSLISYINSLSTGTILAMAISDDAAQTVLGFGGGTPVRQAIETLGSLYIDSVRYRESWCLLGIKGAPQGSVPESYSKLFQGSATIDTSKLIISENGTIVFPTIKNSTRWINIVKSDTLPIGSRIDYLPLGIKSDGMIDTLPELIFTNNSADISLIDASVYPKLKIFTRFTANEFKETPSLNSLGVNFISPAELGTNYQVVSSTADTILIGEDIGLNFYVYNVGEVTADTFKVKVDVIDEDNSRNTVFETLVDSIQSGNRKYFTVSYNTSSGSGDKTFLIDIDSDQEVTELFEDNNFYSVPFYVKQDTSKPLLNIAFDGIDILDGDYISPNPEIKIGLSDFSLLPITDTSAVTLFLNDQQVYYAENQSTLSAQFNSENPKVVVTYTPDLPDGDYVLKVFGQNSLGNMVDSTGVEKHFIVSDELKLLNVYNYPNPTSGETYFTFKLTQIPDELNIKIYTVAGRLIKEISIPGSDLNFDFNKVYWDGRDEDGDNLANGVYLYKVVVTSGDNTEDVIQKLAIVR